jgi:alpha-1,3-rhamnosyl/mannosyltransferase
MTIHVGIEASTWWNERGFGRFTRSLVSALLERQAGFRYTLIIDRPPDESLPFGVPVLEAHAGRSITESAVGTGRRSFAEGLALGRAAARERFDLLFYPAVYSWAPALPGTHSLVTFHDTIAEQYPALTFPHWHNRLAWQLKCAAARRTARRILTVSEASARALHEHFGIPRDKLDVTVEAAAPVFVQCTDAAQLVAARERHGVSADVPLLVYAGGLNPHKNVAGLLRAMTRVFARHPDVHLMLIGDTSGKGFYDNVSELLHLAQMPELRGRVSFPGFVPDAELALLLSAATAFVFPSLCEGFGLPVLEAMACGTPVITSSSSSLPEVGGDAAIRVDPHDTIDLSDAVYRVLANAELREELRERGLKWVGGFTWRHTGEQVSRLLDDVRAGRVEYSRAV